jgi:hypothetical protein
MTNAKEKACSIGRTKECTMDSGWMVSNTERDVSIRKMEMDERAFGKRVGM